MAVLRIMKRSPYRNYLEGEVLDASETAYYKIILKNERVPEVRSQIEQAAGTEKYRLAVREQKGAPGVSAIYVYDAEATIKNAEAELLKRFVSEDPNIKVFHVYSKNGYHTEHDALRVLSRIEGKYEPVSLKRS